MSEKTNLKKTMKNYRMFFLGLSIGLIFIIGAVVGISLSIDSSIVNQLQHYSQTVRTNDMFNPIVVNDNTGFLEIEITLPKLTVISEIVPDASDMFVAFLRMENPISSVYDWVTSGELIFTDWLWGDELESFCDNPDVTNTYYTHFYRELVASDLSEGFTYVLYLEFWDADGEFQGCEDLKEILDGEVGTPPEEEVRAIIIACDYVSFFEYQEITNGNGGTPTPTTTPTGTPTNIGDTGADADGWLNQYTIFPWMKNGEVLLIIIIFFGLLGLLLLLILFFFLKKKDEKKKKKKTKKKK